MRHYVVGARSYSEWMPWAVLAVAAPLLFQIPITHDAIWQIWLGQQMLHGSRLYTNILEVNPPLWFWTAIPLAAVSEAFRISFRLVVIAFFVCAVGLSLYLTPTRFRLPLLGVLVLLPLPSFGQREHFALVASAPYVFAIAARIRGQRPRRPVMVGLFAAFGLCLKPHFLIVPLVLEAFVWRHKRLRPETMALVAFGVAYTLSIPLFAPAYLTLMLPMIRRYYGSFGQQPAYFIPVTAFVLAIAGAWLGRRKGTCETRTLIAASVAFIPAVLLQDKGFDYHSIPVRGFLCLAILLELRSPCDLLGDAMLAGAAMLCCLPTGLYHNVFRREMERHLAGARGSIIVIDSNPSMAWPMVEEDHLDWRLHAMSAWQISAVVSHPELLPQVRRIFAPDLATHPDILVLDRRPTLGPIAHLLIPPGYLRCYALRLRTARMESYARRC